MSVPPVQHPMVVRDATHDDAEALAALSGQLGYPADAPAIVRRLSRVVGRDAGVALVAVDTSGHVRGFARAIPQHFVAEESFVELAALVVDESARGQGVGKSLLAAVEAWSRARGFDRICVRSNVVRDRAHRFYLRAGYAEVKRQAVFAKTP